MYYEIDESAARLAKQMMSFSEYEEGSATLQYWVMVDDAAALVAERKAELSEFYYDQLDALLDKYARRLAEWTNAHNRNLASCPSVMISGGSNFPVAKKRRQNARDDTLMREYQEIEKLLEKIRAVGKGGVNLADPHAREAIEDRLKRYQAMLEQMKERNAYYRKHGTLRGCDGMTDAEADAATDPEAFGIRVHGKPYPDFQLASVRGKIKRMQARLDELDKLDAERAGPQQSVKFDGGEVVRNAELNRLQILFDEVPDVETRQALKGNGFRWSPKNQAWQRQLTANAESAAKRVLGVSI